jgi:hypothetical protein
MRLQKVSIAKHSGSDMPGIMLGCDFALTAVQYVKIGNRI